MAPWVIKVRGEEVNFSCTDNKKFTKNFLMQERSEMADSRALGKNQHLSKPWGKRVATSIDLLTEKGVRGSIDG